MNYKKYQYSKNDALRLIKLYPEVFEEAYKEAYQEQRKEDVDLISIVILGLSMMSLEDVYGFGKTRLKRYKDNFQMKLENLEEGYYTVDDMVKYFKERGIELID